MSLKTHYQRVIHEQLNNDLFNLPAKNWKLPLKIATKWVRSNLGTRLSQETVSQVEKLLTARTENAERSARHSAGIQTPARQQPATHSPFTKSTPQPPEVDGGNTLKIDNLRNELTSALENFKRRIRSREERRTEPEKIDSTTQTQMGESKTGERTTQTETNDTATHHRTTQTEAAKRWSKGVGLQVQPPPLDTSTKDTQTVLTVSRKNWVVMDGKLKRLAQKGH